MILNLKILSLCPRAYNDYTLLSSLLDMFVKFQSISNVILEAVSQSLHYQMAFYCWDIITLPTDFWYILHCILPTFSQINTNLSHLCAFKCNEKIGYLLMSWGKNISVPGFLFSFFYWAIQFSLFPFYPLLWPPNLQFTLGILLFLLPM